MLGCPRILRLLIILPENDNVNTIKIIIYLEMKLSFFYQYVEYFKNIIGKLNFRFNVCGEEKPWETMIPSMDMQKFAHVVCLEDLSL